MSKRVFISFHYYECDDFAAYLTDVATKGWALYHWGQAWCLSLASRAG